MLKAKGGWEGPGRGRRVALLDAFSTSQTPEGVSCICWGHIFPFPARLIHYGADSRWWNQWSRCESSWKIMSFSLTADSIVWVYLGCYSACIMLYTCKYLHEHPWKYKLYFPKSLHIFVKMQVHFCIIFSFCVNNLSSLMISGCLGLMLTDRQIWTAGRPVKHKYQDLAFGTCAGQGLELSFSWTILEPENWGIIMPEWIWYILGIRRGWWGVIQP